MNSAKGIIKKEYIAIFVAVIMLASVSVLSLVSISDQSGNARVVNYAGIVRGGTQRLVKEELYGVPNDKLLARLDSIVNDLISGSVSLDPEEGHALISLPGKEFQDKMQQIKATWSEIQVQIAAVRAAKVQLESDIEAKKDLAYSEAAYAAAGQELFDSSEEYFALADETVSAAETYSKSQVEFSRNIILGADLIFALLLVVVTIYIIRQQALQRKNEQFKTQALLDTLTGIPNRMRCEQECNKIESQRPVENIAAFMFDMNNLKVVNDRFGHQAGDKLIIALARMLRDWAESYGGFAGRFGGDEFLALFVGTDTETTEQRLQELYAAVDVYNGEQKSDFDQLSFAAGYTVNNLAIVSLEVMIIDADRAMYERKRQMKTMD